MELFPSDSKLLRISSRDRSSSSRSWFLDKLLLSAVFEKLLLSMSLNDVVAFGAISSLLKSSIFFVSSSSNSLSSFSKSSKSSKSLSTLPLFDEKTLSLVVLVFKLDLFISSFTFA